MSILVNRAMGSLMGSLMRSMTRDGMTHGIRRGNKRGAGGLALCAAAALWLALPGAVRAGPDGAQSKLDKAAAFQGIGRPATPAEINAWDIDVRPDFKGLPKGAGSVARGQAVWESKCASCHGVFGESNEVFTPIATGIVKEDIKTGHASSLTKGGGQRSTLMKVATLSTLWDYINRAMPWNAPKTLSTEEVYAVTAYILNLGNIVPDDFTLSDANMMETQARMPNRNGMTQKHAMWSVKAKPDVNGSNCMRNCAVDAKVASFLPDYAKNAHGNLAEQNRPVGGVRGVDTTVATAVAAGTAAAPGAAAGAAGGASTAAAPPAGAAMPATSAAAAAGAATAKAPAKAPSEFAGIKDTANKGTCLACHGIDRKVVGPGFSEIAAKYKGDAKAEAYLAGKIRSGGQGVWGAIPMPPAAALNAGEAALLAKWIMKGTPQQ